MSTETKTCPYCGEEISVNAKKCIHCKEWLEPLSPSQIITPERHPTEQPVYPRQQEPVPYINDPYQIRQPYYRQSETRQQVIVNQSAHESNGMGTAGFILSLISFVLSWVPGIGWVVWFLGALFSFFGLFKSPRGLAVAGIIISFIDLIILMSVVGAIASIFS